MLIAPLLHCSDTCEVAILVLTALANMIFFLPQRSSATRHTKTHWVRRQPSCSPKAFQVHIFTVYIACHYMQNIFLLLIDSVFSQKTPPLMQAKHNRVFAHYCARIHTFNYVEQSTKPITQVQTPDTRVYHV